MPLLNKLRIPSRKFVPKEVLFRFLLNLLRGNFFVKAQESDHAFVSRKKSGSVAIGWLQKSDNWTKTYKLPIVLINYQFPQKSWGRQKSEQKEILRLFCGCQKRNCVIKWNSVELRHALLSYWMARWSMNGRKTETVGCLN